MFLEVGATPLSVGVLPFELPKEVANLVSRNCTVGPPEGLLVLERSLGSLK